ncbi:MAG TPA: hypothetical protein VKB43_02255, partial [Gaiellaceae bacterium]|nr:hypothetical protein [Gaiellaceae bacterium]
MPDDTQTEEIGGGRYVVATIAEAESLLMSGNTRKGLHPLSNAAYNVRPEGNWEAAFARIRSRARDNRGACRGRALPEQRSG